MLLKRIRKLRQAGVVGMNQRNRSYVMKHNVRRLYHLVDDKVQTKLLAQKAHIPVPELYGLIKTPHDARNFTDIVKNKNDFVIKPARGSGGNGILVIAEQRREKYFKADGTALDLREVEHHIQNILGGVYSLGGQPDAAIIEYRVKFDPIFEAVSYRGVPDIRVLVYRGVPAMAMLRLPTKKSDGRANLHQGAVGVGIEMRSGVTTSAVCNNKRVSEHPDFDTPLAGLAIPHWSNILLLAARCQTLAPLGYLGVDLVLDAELGPLVLELNARPGLAIQIANAQGLEIILDKIDSQVTDALTAEEKAALTSKLATPAHQAA